MNSPASIKLVAITGGSGAGKSWLVTRLCERLGERACHLQLDDFYRDCSHLPMSRRGQINFDVPDAIDWDAAERVLLDCREGRATHVPCYDFAAHTRNVARERRDWRPRPVVLVDGLWLLRLPWIRDLFSLKIYLDVPAAVRCRRRLARDVAERGYATAAIERQLRTAVLPMHDRYVEPQRAWADIVLTHPITEQQIAALVARLPRWASASSPTPVADEDVGDHHETAAATP